MAPIDHQVVEPEVDRAHRSGDEGEGVRTHASTRMPRPQRPVGGGKCGIDVLGLTHHGEQDLTRAKPNREVYFTKRPGRSSVPPAQHDARLGGPHGGQMGRRTGSSLGVDLGMAGDPPSPLPVDHA